MSVLLSRSRNHGMSTTNSTKNNDLLSKSSHVNRSESTTLSQRSNSTGNINNNNNNNNNNSKEGRIQKWALKTLNKGFSSVLGGGGGNNGSSHSNGSYLPSILETGQQPQRQRSRRYAKSARPKSCTSGSGNGSNNNSNQGMMMMGSESERSCSYSYAAEDCSVSSSSYMDNIYIHCNNSSSCSSSSSSVMMDEIVLTGLDIAPLCRSRDAAKSVDSSFLASFGLTAAASHDDDDTTEGSLNDFCSFHLNATANVSIHRQDDSNSNSISSNNQDAKEEEQEEEEIIAPATPPAAAPAPATSELVATTQVVSVMLVDKTFSFQNRFEEYVKEKLRTTNNIMLQTSGSEVDQLNRLLNEDFTEFLLVKEQQQMQQQQGASMNSSNNSSNTSSSNLSFHLAAAHHLLRRLFAIQEVVYETCVMPGTTMETLWTAVEDFLHPRISNFYYQSGGSSGATGGSNTRHNINHHSNNNNNKDGMGYSSSSNIQDWNNCHTNNGVRIKEDLTPRDAATVISWIDDLMDALETSCHVSMECSPVWKHDQVLLADAYLERAVRQPMNECVHVTMRRQAQADGLRRQREDAVDGEDRGGGILVTEFPEQVSFMIAQQLKAAEECLPYRYREQVLDACNDAIAVYVGETMVRVSSHWKDMDVAEFCAIINDTAHLADQCSDRNDAVFQRSSERLVLAGEQVVTDLVEMALHTTNYLSERIVYDLCLSGNPILSSVGTETWYRHSNYSSDESKSAVNRAVATFQDYFHDIEEFLLKDYYFPKVLRNCFDSLLQSYIESFFSNTLSAERVQQLDPAAASIQITMDYMRLLQYFHGDTRIANYHGVAGFYSESTIASRLNIFQNMASLLDPALPPRTVLNDVKAVLQQFQCGESGTAVVLHLVGLRKVHQGQEAVEWLKVISQAKQEIVTEQRQMRLHRQAQKHQGDAEDFSEFLGSPVSTRESQHGGKQQPQLYVYKIPDLRNSKSLGNIQVGAREMDRMMSSKTLQHAESSRQLLSHSVAVARRDQWVGKAKNATKLIQTYRPNGTSIQGYLDTVKTRVREAEQTHRRNKYM